MKTKMLCPIFTAWPKFRSNCMGTMAIAINRRGPGTKKNMEMPYHPFVPNVCASDNAFSKAHYILLDNPELSFVVNRRYNISVAVSQLLGSCGCKNAPVFFFDISTASLHFI